MTSLTSFRSFPLLPTELQLKIFHHASNASPRVLDIWTGFQKRETGNTIFYIQHYESEVSPFSRIAPAILSVSKAARNECLKCYSREFVCEMTLPGSGDSDADGETTSEGSGQKIERKFETPPRMWINFNIDVIVPRGFWNLVSFPDFASQVHGRMRRVAIDVEGVFWKENLRDYCRMCSWALNGVEEVFLYGSGRPNGSAQGSRESEKEKEKMFWMKSEYLENFQERGVGKRELGLEPFFVTTAEDSGEEWSACERAELHKLRNVESFLIKLFDVIEGHSKVEGDDDFGDVRKAEFVDMTPTTKEEFKRPVIRLMRLVTSIPEENS